jgi:hypothetical protein
VRGVFDGDIEIAAEALSARRTRLRQTERFTGILSALMTESYYERARRDLEAANLAVKAWAEELEAAGVVDPAAPNAHTAAA